MEPIRKGDRGPAVEDVQRRLLALGEDLGSTGVDGVFLGTTFAAVCRFQRAHRLVEDGIVGPETWSALVDATFALGDRLLYLRRPHFHGADVAILQGALNALGFAAGEPDGIFGTFTEGAVREFQDNAGLPVDGIAGPDTVRTVMYLRHVWADKAPGVPDGLRSAAARSTDRLARLAVAAVGRDEAGAAVAARLANVAAAADERLTIAVGDDGGRELVLEIGASREGVDRRGAHCPTVAALDGGPQLASRFAAAMVSLGPAGGRVLVALGADELDERSVQRIAVGLLDGLCIGAMGT